MAVSPINVARVTQGLRSFNLLNTVRGSQLEMFRTQNQLATGLRFSTPSEDPTRAAAANQLDRRMAVLRQLQENLREVNLALAEGETAMQEAIDQAIDTHTIASEAASDTMSADERNSLRVVVEANLDQMIAIANRRYLDNYLFSGQFGDAPPFEWTDDGVIFRGDAGRMQAILDTDLTQDTYTISGMEFFNAVSGAVRGAVDLNPRVTLDTRLSDLGGATGTGIQSGGRIVVTSGAEQVSIDLTTADTVGDVIDLLNASLPGSLSAQLVGNAIQIQSGGETFTVTDAAGGRSAVELGIFTSNPVVNVFGDDLDARLTPRTRIEDLQDGGGLSLTSGIRIRNGGRVADVDFSGVETVEDVLNRINQSDAGVMARISEDGKSIDVLNRISGADLRIEENGGQTASLLGIRSMQTATKIADLNDGVGVHTVEGDDFQIVTRSGATIAIDLDDLDLRTATLGDLIDHINAVAGGAVTAGLTSQGNGLVITDNTAGPGELRIEKLNVSPAIDMLGLNVAAAGGQITGTDVNPVRVDSVFTAMLELRDALAADDARAITAAGERLNRTLDGMQEVQGRLAAKAKVMAARSERIADEVTSTQVLQSDVRDVDLTEALVRFQQVQTALQANLTTSSQILGLSLLDFLR
ncbi:MAG: hypothetical protein D6744_08245 [Planctomycetota bacterium]|nr:MAG: hypothetical protein D6744_08245 [Planctomycetota bacterium]